MKISKWIASALVMALLVSLMMPGFPIHAHATDTDLPTIRIGSVEGKPGETVQVPVEIIHNPGITFLNARVLFDETAVQVHNARENTEGNPLTGMMFMPSPKDGANPVTIYYDSGLVDKTGDGIIAYVDVTIKDNAIPGDYAVEFVAGSVSAFNTSYQTIVFETIGAVITVVGEECAEHEWSQWEAVNAPGCESEGTEKRTCAVCGETQEQPVAALGHSFTHYTANGDATCEADGTETAVCDRCDATDTRTAAGSATGHSFGEYVSNNDATCVADGTETAHCVNCDAPDTRTDVGSKNDAPHSFPADYTSDNNAACTADGTMSRVCALCGEKETVTEPGSALGHDFSAETTDYPATEADCCHKAAYYYACVRCGEQGEETFAYGEVDASKHVGGTEVRGQKAPTEDADGYTGDTYCLGCGALLEAGQSIPKLSHTHDLVKTEAVAATCEAAGNTAYWTCTKCGKLYADDAGKTEITAADTVVDALDHSFTAYVSDGNATCEADGTKTAECDRCDETDTVADPGSKLGHSFTDYVANGDATCEEDGTETAKCDRCDKTDTREDAWSALGHDFSAETTDYPATEADCCHKATYYHSCVRCGKQGEETFAYGEVDASKHVGGTEVRGQKAPTEDADGYTGDTYCLGCGALIEAGQSIPKLNHTHDLVKTEAVAATCEAAGNTAYWTCTKCGKLYADAEGKTEITAADTVVAALGHAYGEWTVTTEPTCTETGVETSTCGNCGATETREVAALGHAYGEWTVTTEPTCTEAGVETSTCANCGATETREVAALGHAYGEWTVTTEPTCTETGVETSTCGNCGATETREVAALGHSFTAYVSDGNATCEADGTKTAKCDRCDETDTVADEGSALGHVYGEWTVTTEATCTETGVETRACANCGATETREVAALGHAYGEWTVTTEPTCTETGVETRTCGSCDAAETREVAALGHAYGEWTVTTEPTCTEDGEQTRTCANCAGVETEVLAAGHTYESVVTDPTATEKGYTTHTCVDCGDSYVDAYVEPKPDLDKVPQTGDAMNGGLWLGVMVLCLMGGCALVTTRKAWMTK